MSPVLPLPRAIDETASRTIAAVNALNELALVRQQHASACRARYPW